MDPATDRAIEALADALIEFGKAVLQMAAAFAVACEALGRAFAVIVAAAAQAQGRDLDAEWMQVAGSWSARN